MPVGAISLRFVGAIALSLVGAMTLHSSVRATVLVGASLTSNRRALCNRVD